MVVCANELGPVQKSCVVEIIRKEISRYTGIKKYGDRECACMEDFWG